MCLMQSSWVKRLLMPIARRYVVMPGETVPFAPAPLTLEQQIARANLLRHVYMLADTIGERSIYSYENLEAARCYLASELAAIGYAVHEDHYKLEGKWVTNVWADQPGRTNRWFFVGGHYDTVKGSPGANDNATGSAATLELARRFFGQVQGMGIRFCLFTNEEHKNAQLKLQSYRQMGSYHHARRARRAGLDIGGMWSLETIGCYLDQPGSQKYPFPFNLFYPDRGNFVAFVGSSLGRDFVHDSIRTFRSQACLPSEGVAAPFLVPSIWRSDHANFQWHGYRRVAMITDTANFRYWPYHTPYDTVDRLDFDSLARLVCGLSNTLHVLAA